MALRYLGLKVSLKLQKSNEKSRRLGKYQYFCRIVSNKAEVVSKYFAILMKIWLAGLLFVIGGHLLIHILPGVGSRCHSFLQFPLCCVGLVPRLKRCTSLFTTKENPGRCLRLDHEVKYLFNFNGKPPNRKWH
jgi:hypothetical protein